MQTTIKTEGMMCHGCENRMVKAMSALAGVISVKADHETGLVTIEHDASFSEKAARDTVLDLGFELA